MTDPIVLTGADLSIADVEDVARRGATAVLDEHARGRMQEARDVIEALVADGAVVYGVTTGFGDLASTFIPAGDTRRLQENLLMSHAAGVGPAFPREVVRAMLLLRANTLALGHSVKRTKLSSNAAFRSSSCVIWGVRTGVLNAPQIRRETVSGKLHFPLFRMCWLH